MDRQNFFLPCPSRLLYFAIHVYKNNAEMNNTKSHCSFLKYYITSDMHCLIPPMLGGCLYSDVYFAWVY